MLGYLAGRNVPLLSLDDFLGLADACPSELDTDRIRKLGLLPLRGAMPAEQEIWLKQALEKGTRQARCRSAKRVRHWSDPDARRFRRTGPHVSAERGRGGTDRGRRGPWRDSRRSSPRRKSSIGSSRHGSLVSGSSTPKVLTAPDSDNAKRQKSGRSAGRTAGKGPGRGVRTVDTRSAGKRLGCCPEPGDRLGKAGERQRPPTRTSPRGPTNLAAQKTLLRCAGEKADLSQAAVGQRGRRHGGWVGSRGGAHL